MAKIKTQGTDLYVAPVSGSVSGVTVSAGGTGYVSAPTVAFAAPPAGGVQATGTAVLTDDAVTSVTITNPGAGYTSAPAITFTGGSGSGATATAAIDGDAVKLACITAFSGLGGARGQIDVTCFSSEEMEFEGGMANPGQITVGGNYDSADAVFPRLVALKDSAEIVDWYLGGSDGTANPTVVAGVITAPAARTGITFRGYVADITWQMDASSVWKYQLVIQRSGGWNLVPKS